MHFSLEGADVHRAWPAPPQVPRYSYLGELTGEDNFKADASGRNTATRLLHWLVGINRYRKRQVLQRPMCGIVGPNGRIYVTDVGRQAVFVFDLPAGRLRVWKWARAGTRFETPVGIALGPGGQILVADAGLKGVFRLDHAGRPLGEIGAGVLKRPTGLARDARLGLIYVADTGANDIKVFNDDGKLVKVIGRRGRGPGEFNGPTHITFAGDRLYVSDTLNARIEVFDARGKYLRTFGRRGLYLGDLVRPKGVAVDNEGDVYVVESYYGYLLVYNKRGRFLLPIGGTGSGVGQFYLPAGVWVGPHDRVYVADMFNARVVVFQYLGARK
ncbi:MAG TPA: 6-bladed beta-propeller [Chromatiales bacterium]|nr:6-bladed beta-propeller [Chromatiales bacterium]HDO34496.1 6-bladed beta-propeller [Chromatiales bacterium]